MLRKLFTLILLIALNSYSHSVKEGDMDGSWRAIEAFINGEAQEVVDGLMVASEGYMSVNWTGADGNKYFNYSSYEVNSGMVNVEILNHSLDQYIGAKFSHKPNFMGDKKSYITTFVWDDVEYTHRWEKMSCSYEKCARISDFKN
jgi:hypothetical protein